MRAGCKCYSSAANNRVATIAWLGIGGAERHRRDQWKEEIPNLHKSQRNQPRTETIFRGLEMTFLWGCHFSTFIFFPLKKTLFQALASLTGLIRPRAWV